MTGFAETGAALCRAGVDKIAFTGSAATGKKVMAACAETLTPVLMELGGKDAMIVDEDADVTSAADGAVWGAMSNAGQTCIGIERVYVAEKVFDEFVTEARRLASELRPGSDESASYGPMTMPSQADVVRRHLSDAQERGGRTLTGGSVDDDPSGAVWVAPTVLVDVPEESTAVREETFGPTLTVTKVRDAEEALRLANDTRYGLNASVWTRDAAKGARLAGQVEAGSVCVNDVIMGVAVTDAPFGGVKESGTGRRHGAPGIRRFASEQTIVIDRFGLRREAVWYPYTARGERLLLRLLGALFSTRAAARVRSLLGR